MRERVDRTCLAEARFFFRRDDDLDFARDLAGDFTLQRKDVAKIALVTFGPEVLVGGGVDELGRDADALAVTKHRAFDDGVDVEFASDDRQ